MKVRHSMHLSDSDTWPEGGRIVESKAEVEAGMHPEFVPREVLKNYWFPVARSSEISVGPVQAKLLDWPIVLWRSNGVIVAAHDLCIHRGTRLSLGHTNDAGQLVCGYHGWHYESDGRCSRIPSRPGGSIPEKARVAIYQVQEKYGLVWACLGEPCAEIPEFPPEFDDASWGWDRYSLEERWQANAARLIENMLDASHFPWVHTGMLGVEEAAEVPDIHVEMTEDGFEFDLTIPFNPQTQKVMPFQRHYRLILPFTLILDSTTPETKLRDFLITVATPISANEVRFFTFIGRKYDSSDSPNGGVYKSRLPDQELNERSKAIIEQDREIVESQRPEELPIDLSEELHIRGPDRAAVEYRRLLRKLSV